MDRVQRHARATLRQGLAAAILFCCGDAPAAEEIRVHCRGQGPPVYLIGGGPAFTTWNLQPIQDRLGKGYRVCRWDMRGVGDNARLPVKAEVSALVQWLPRPAPAVLSRNFVHTRAPRS